MSATENRKQFGEKKNQKITTKMIQQARIKRISKRKTRINRPMR